MQVAELPRRHAERILVLTGKCGEQKLVIWMRRDEALIGRRVAMTNAVTRQLQQRIHAAFHARHHREREAKLTAMRQHGGLHEPCTDVVARVGEVRRERHHQVLGVDPARPVGEETADLARGLLRKLGRHIVAPVAQARGGRLVPGQEQRINAQGGGETLISLKTALPDHPLHVVERRVGHADAFHACDLHAVRGVVGHLPSGEPLAELGQVALLHV